MLNTDLLQINLTDRFTQKKKNSWLYIEINLVFIVGTENFLQSNNLFSGDKNVSERCRRADKSLSY